MCGIAGILSPQKPLQPALLKRMADALRHRGPDSEGYATLPFDAEKIQPFSGPESYQSIRTALPDVNTSAGFSLGMAFRRLAIIDLSDCGHQPMLSADGQVAMTFNGEIYNFRELRKELQAEGYAFRSQTDSEVILAGYVLHGIGFIERLNGMFAIAIYDHRVRRLYLVRDRLGIKPLYYATSSDGTVCWASEAKALFASGVVKAEADWNKVLHNYQLQASKWGCFKGVDVVEPGWWKAFDTTTGEFVDSKQYWQIRIGNTIKISGRDAEAELRARLEKIAARQTISDAPLISFMSGGIDSTTVTALCGRQRAGMKAYTLGFGGGLADFDELPQARAAARHIGVEHVATVVREDEILELLLRSFKVFEQPYSGTDPELLSAKHLSGMGYRVAMSGLGADEVFGGYSYYRKWAAWQKLVRHRRLLNLAPRSIDKIKRAQDYIGTGSIYEYYMHHRGGMRAGELETLMPGTNTGQWRLGYTMVPLHFFEPPLNEVLSFLDLVHNIGTHHCMREDQAAMSQSLEVRYPFLDHELIEWATTLPDAVRFGRHEGKPLLRAVAREFIAPENLTMPKRGFNLPLAHWYHTVPGVKALFEEYLTALRARGIFQNTTVDAWMREPTDRHIQLLWLLVSTEGWLREYVDAQP